MLPFRFPPFIAPHSISFVLEWTGWSSEAIPTPARITENALASQNSSIFCAWLSAIGRQRSVYLRQMNCHVRQPRRAVATVLARRWIQSPLDAPREVDQQRTLGSHRQGTAPRPRRLAWAAECPQVVPPSGHLSERATPCQVPRCFVTFVLIRREPDGLKLPRPREFDEAAAL